MKLLLTIAILIFFPVAASATDVYPDLVSGSYTFKGQPGAPIPDQTPTASIGALRVDGAPGDQGVLDCQAVDPADYMGILTFTVTLTDMTQNAEVRIVAFPKDDCTGTASPMSDDAARMFLIAPIKPTLLP
jgi:hypothetical protein